jgi:cell pole-organizing protein PopZ
MRFAVGDMSTETSMEDILSSIKRIIAEEGDGPVSRVRKPVRAPAPAYDEDDEDEVLELNDAVSEPLPPRAAAAPMTAAPAPAAAPQPEIDPAILSARAAEASRSALEALSRMVVKPEAPGADSLEGLVREMLRPMLRDWLDAKLPAIVETMVAREIARISGRE